MNDTVLIALRSESLQTFRLAPLPFTAADSISRSELEIQMQRHVRTLRFEQVLRDSTLVSSAHPPVDQKLDRLVIVNCASLRPVIPDSQRAFVVFTKDRNRFIHRIKRLRKPLSVLCSDLAPNLAHTIGVGEELPFEPYICGNPFGKNFTALFSMIKSGKLYPLV